MSFIVPPVLSVIIPTYNRPDFLSRCLESLRLCGYPNLEIIIADDGSTENIATVVQGFEPACIYLRQENQGPNAARNHGFAHSQGRYVAFLDSDDQWLPDTAQEVVEILEGYPIVDMIFTEARMGNQEEGYRSWIEFAGGKEFHQLPCHVTTEGLRIFDKTELWRQMLARNMVVPSATVMRREAFERAGMFDPGIRLAEDWELWLRMAAEMQLAFYPKPLALKVVHPGCASHDGDGMGEGFITALMKVRSKCSQLNPEDMKILERQLRMHLFNHAYHAYNSGHYRLARQRFSRLQKVAGLTVREALLRSLCLLPSRLVRILRKCKWMLGG